MAIVCRKCKCAMSKTEIFSYVMCDVYDIVKDIAQNTAKEIVLSYLIKRNYAEDSCLTYANAHKIFCPECFEYTGWKKIKDQIDESIELVEIESEDLKE